MASKNSNAEPTNHPAPTTADDLKLSRHRRREPSRSHRRADERKRQAQGMVIAAFFAVMLITAFVLIGKGCRTDAVPTSAPAAEF